MKVLKDVVVLGRDIEKMKSDMERDIEYKLRVIEKDIPKIVFMRVGEGDSDIEVLKDVWSFNTNL